MPGGRQRPAVPAGAGDPLARKLDLELIKGVPTSSAAARSRPTGNWSRCTWRAPRSGTRPRRGACGGCQDNVLPAAEGHRYSARGQRRRRLRGQRAPARHHRGRGHPADQGADRGRNRPGRRAPPPRPGSEHPARAGRRRARRPADRKEQRMTETLPGQRGNGRRPRGGRPARRVGIHPGLLVSGRRLRLGAAKERRSRPGSPGSASRCTGAPVVSSTRLRTGARTGRCR